MDALQAIIDLARAYVPTADYPIILDREKQIGIAALRAQHQVLSEKLQGLDSSDDEGATLGEEPAADRLSRELVELEQRIADAEEAAKDQSVVLVFGRLPTTPDGAEEGEAVYSDLKEQHTGDDRHVDFEGLGAALMPVCYLRTESAHGDLGLSWHEAARLLGTADFPALRNMLLGHHEMGASIPFDPRSSGRPEAT